MEKVKKVCKSCDEEKSLSQFYKHKGMLDGHLNICKTCKREYSSRRERELRKDPNWVEKEKARGREKHRRLGTKKPTYEMKKKTIARYNSKYPEKRKAKNVSESIFTPVGLEKHHWSYNEEHYKDVIFLTNRLHNKLHRFLEYDSTTFMYRCMVGLGDFKQGDLLDTKGKHTQFLNHVKTF